MKAKQLITCAVTLLPLSAFAGISTPTQVPEPQTLVLMAVAGIAVYLFKRKK